MRSKKFRIVLTGGFLTLLAVVAFRKGSAASGQVVSQQVKNHAIANVEHSTPVAEAAAFGEEASGAELLQYTDKPATAAKVERLMAAATKEVHYAKIDRELLGGSNSPLAKEGGRVSFTLPDGRSVPVLIQKAQNLGAERYVSEGTIEGEGFGRAVFAYNQGELSAVIDDISHGSWQIRAMGDSVAQVFEVDHGLVPPCGASPEKHAAHSHSEAPEARSVMTAAAQEIGSGPSPVAGMGIPGGWAEALGWPLLGSIEWSTQVRVLVPYSSVILTVLPEWAVVTWIDVAIASMNSDLARSGLPVKVVLAGAVPVQYNQEWQGSDDTALDDALVRVANSADGIMDEIHVMRADVQADLVCFAMCQHDSNNSGIGYILKYPGDGFNSTWAFSAVDFWYMNSSSVFSHELGHNFGCNHDRENARTTTGVQMTGSHSYSYGYRFYGEDGQQYRTIMSYSPGRALPYYSNPYITAPYPINVPIGAHMGTWDEAYNAMTILQNTNEVSNYSLTRAVVRTAKRLRGW